MEQLSDKFNLYLSLPLNIQCTKDFPAMRIRIHLCWLQPWILVSIYNGVELQSTRQTWSINLHLRNITCNLPYNLCRQALQKIKLWVFQWSDRESSLEGNEDTDNNYNVTELLDVEHEIYTKKRMTPDMKYTIAIVLSLFTENVGPVILVKM